MFFKFPYTDLYTLNLDWMIKYLQETQTNLEQWREIIDNLGTVVHSVNGQTGDVNLGTLVNSVNGKTGIVNLGTLVNSVNGKTGNVEIDNDDINALKIELVLQTTDPVSTFTPAVVTPLFNSGIRFIIINNKEFYSITEAGAMIRFNPFEDLNISKELAQPPANQAEIEALYNQGIRFIRYAVSDVVRHYALEKINSVVVAYDLNSTNGANLFNFIDSNETISDYSTATLQSMYNSGVRIVFQDETNGIRKFYALLGTEVDGYTGYTEYDPVNYFDTQFVPSLQSEISNLKSAIVSNDTRLDKIENEVGGGAITITPSLSTRKDGYYGRNVTTNKLRYAESTAYYTVELVDISKLVAGTQVKMMASVNSAYGIFITDDGLNVLDYVDGNNAESKGYTTGSTPQLVTLTIPQNAKYITSDIRNAYFTDMSIFAVVGTQKDNITLMQEEVSGLSVNGNVLSGKKWVACGDSFTAGSFGYSLTDNYIFEDGLYAGNYKVYPFWIGRRNPFMEVVNEAISGSTMTGGESGVNPFSGTRYTAIPSDTDYITLEFGINDSGHGVPIGTIDDTTNETFYGAWNVVLGYFMEHFPFAHIGIIVGPGMQTSNGQQYANAEIEIAKKWGIPYLNIQFESGGGKIPLMLRTNNPDVSQAVKSACNERQFVNPSTETPNYHPNEDAHEFESTFIETWLRTL